METSHKQWKRHGGRIAIACLILFIFPWVWSTFGLGNEIAQFCNRLNSGVYVLGPTSLLSGNADSCFGGYCYTEEDVIYTCRVTLENTTDSPKDVELIAFMPVEFCLTVLKSPFMHMLDEDGESMVFHLEPKSMLELQDVDFSVGYNHKAFPKLDRTLPVIWVMEADRKTVSN